MQKSCLFTYVQSSLEQESFSIELNRICSSLSGLLETSLEQKVGTLNKILCGGKILAFKSIE